MECQSSKSVTLNIDEVVCLISSQLKYYQSLYQCHRDDRNLPLIHRVKKQIRDVDPVAYEPIILSIGPYHHYSPSVLSLQKTKWACLKAILDANHLRELQDYLRGIMEIEEHVRSCYQGNMNMESDKFIQILLLDGCFLLYSLYGIDEIGEFPSQGYQENENNGEEVLFHENTRSTINMSSKHKGLYALAVESDQGKTDVGHHHIRGPGITSNSKHSGSQDSSKGKWYSSFIARDILLLENQIPFFVLKLIYEIVAYKKNVNTPLSETLAKFVEIIVESYPKSISSSEIPKDFHHLLHLCHIYMKPSQNFPPHREYHIKSHYMQSLVNNCGKHSNEHKDTGLLFNHTSSVHLKDDKQLNRWRRAVQYHEAGVQFKRREHSKHAPHSLLDVSFDRGVLQIPCLPIDDNTGSLFRNLIAFEQACPNFGNDFTAYVSFISHLISTPDDVTLLSLKGIVVHHMRFDSDISNIFGKLGKNVDFDMNGSYYLKPMCQRLEEHYQSRINRWLAWLWQNHFSNPWLSLAVVAAAIVLICTILQTITSFLAYLHPAA